jgi:hypothetical protein
MSQIGKGALIAALRALERPDRNLDCQIHAHVIAPGEPIKVIGPPTYDQPRLFVLPKPHIDWIGYDLLNISPYYTADLEAAAQLITSDFDSWTLVVRQFAENENRRRPHDYPFVATVNRDEMGFVAYSRVNAAVALCEAALSARPA